MLINQIINSPIIPVANSIILIIPIAYLIFWTVFITFMPSSEKGGIYYLALVTTLGFFLLCLEVWSKFSRFDGGMQFACSIPLIPAYHLYLPIAVDGISLTFLLLTAFVMPFCVFSARTIEKGRQQFISFILWIEVFLVLTFTVTNLFWFFVFFESVLIPMYFLIGIWGSRSRKVAAGYYFFLYTLVGSFFLLFGIIYLWGSVSSFDYETLLHLSLSQEEQIIVFILFSIPFAIKIPMFPFHIWLPEAHVEAPTVGSVILASLLLKLGGYGFFRFVIPLCPLVCDDIRYIVYICAILSIIYASLTACRQSDLKKIIAYSSIAHMNVVVLALFSNSQEAIEGGIYLMIAHGVVSMALFLLVGVPYDRHHTRSLKQYSGLLRVTPFLCFFFFMFSLANMGFPGTCNFVGEFLVFAGLFESNTWILLLATPGIVLSAVYSIWLYNRFSSGTLKEPRENVSHYADLTRSEIFVFGILLIVMLILGMNSNIVTSLTSLSISRMLVIVNSKKEKK